MLKKFFSWIEAKFKIDVNENLLTTFIVLVAIGFAVAAVAFGGAVWANIIGLGAGIAVNVAAFVGVAVLLELFLCGIGFDVADEIKKGNVAMAINLLGWRLGLAIVIAKGIL